MKRLTGLSLENRQQVDSLDDLLVLAALNLREHSLICPFGQLIDVRLKRRVESKIDDPLGDFPSEARGNWIEEPIKDCGLGWSDHNIHLTGV